MSQTATGDFSAETVFLDRKGNLQPLFLKPKKVEVAEPVQVQAVSLRRLLGDRLSSVPEVEAVYLSQQDGALHVWIVVDDFDREVRERVYQREMAVIDEFKDYEFDFSILSRRGRDLKAVIDDSWLDEAFLRT